MTELPDTRESLLLRVRDPKDRDAWDQFVSIYRPVVYRMARAKGIQDADAQDLSQRVLISVSQAIEKWQPREGTRFRHWLAKVAKNAAINTLSRQPKDVGQGGSEHLLRMKEFAGQHWSESYELEFQRQMFRRAAEQVRHRADEKTWHSFALTMIDGLSCDEAAERLGISVGSVYAARSRIVRRMREEVTKLSARTVGEESGGEQAVPVEGES
ncbi:MAG: sigma-70 family RNA polymerase sigma factor [Planctomycetota bacterium]